MAIGLVLTYHLWPERLTGGFVGVDVFFVISGYLITLHIAESLEARQFSVRGFYSRRIRRLIPAAFTVLSVTLIATWAFAPRAQWNSFVAEIAASTVYAQNWLLAAKSVDYLGAESGASPVQHYWTLSVEEQFYIVWPLLLLLVVAMSRRRAMLAVAIGAVLSASLAYSIWLTAVEPTLAYFVTGTRVWEFAIGGLVAVTLTKLTLRPATFSLIGIAGISLILVPAVTYSARTPFPGAAALLPTIGTALVIVAGTSGAPALRWIARRRPIQLLGDISYSLYLWHWPLIIFVPIITGMPLTTVVKVVVLCVSIALAWGTRVFIELPAQRARWWAGEVSWRPTVALVVASSVLVVGCGVGWVTIQLQDRTVAAAIGRLEESPCFGAAAMRNEPDCPDRHVVTATVDQAFASTDLGIGIQTGRCELAETAIPATPCEFGQLERPARTFALFGDSHAGQLIESLEPVMQEQGWLLKTWIQGGCPGAGSIGPDWCREWGDSSRQRILDDPTISAVIMSNATSKYAQLPELLDAEKLSRDIESFLSAGLEVYVVRDTPGSVRPAENREGFNVSTCLSTVDLGAVDPCAIDREVLITDDLLVSVARSFPEVIFIDLTSSFCDEQLCHAVIGGLAVYADGGHITRTFARTLAPEFAQALSIPSDQNVTRRSDRVRS